LWLHGVVRPSNRHNPPCRHLHPAPPPNGPHPSWHPRLPRRGGILRVRYVANSHPTDCSCRRTWLPVPRPPPPSSMRVLGECSGASIPRRAAVLRPSPRPS
jgi:hypothetical protein